MQLDELKADLLGRKVSFDDFCCLIVHDVQLWLVTFSLKIFIILFICCYDTGQIEAGNWGGKDALGLVMVHYKETVIAIKHFEEKSAGAVIVNYSCGFIGKRLKEEDVGNRMVINVTNEKKMGFGVGDVVRLNGRDKAGHDQFRECNLDINAQNFQSCTLEASLRTFHVAF